VNNIQNIFFGAIHIDYNSTASNGCGEWERIHRFREAGTNFLKQSVSSALLRFTNCCIFFVEDVDDQDHDT
jgi:hypothetical protein